VDSICGVLLSAPANGPTAIIGPLKRAADPSVDISGSSVRCAGFGFAFQPLRNRDQDAIRLFPASVG